MRLPRLTALRFFAALLVVGVHFSYALPENALGRGLRHGRLGVSFFFVLSGFVLAWSARPADRAGSFYRRRFARVYPLHAVTWAALMGLGLVGALQVGYRTSLPALPLVQAWFPNPDVYFGANSVSWTLSCEAFFYLLFPILLAHLAVRSTRTLAGVAGACWAVMIALALAVGAPNTDHRNWFLTVLPPVRLLEFVVGICVGLAVRRGWRPAVSEPVAVAVALLSIAATFVLPESLSAVSVTLPGFALLLAVCAGRDATDAPGVLRSPVLVTLGEWSFALYLCHQMLFRLLVENGPASPTVRAVIALALVPAAIALAGLLHVVVERPAERELRGRRQVPVTSSS